MKPIFVCHKCFSKVDDAFDFRHKILQAEAEHFHPLRQRALVKAESDEDSEQTRGFDVCRVCLFPGEAVGTTTIFKRRGKNGVEYAEMIFHLTGFNVSFEARPSA